MVKTPLLDEHFLKWCQLTGIPENRFHPDGIIHEASFKETGAKLCFLMKEPNNPDNAGEGGNFDFRKWWKDEPIYGTFSSRVAEWACGVLDGFPPYDDIWNGTAPRTPQNALRAIALVNLNKMGGGGSSTCEWFMELLENDGGQVAELVREQLDIIDPAIIIMGLSWEGLRDRVFPKVEWKPSGYGIQVGAWKGRKLIDFYHPSSRSAPPALYCLLEKVMASEAFRTL
jgi:hypothetical protein